MKRVKIIEFRGNRSQIEMANIYGVSQQAWSKYENGTTKPELELMVKISNDMGEKIEDIFLNQSTT